MRRRAQKFITLCLGFWIAAHFASAPAHASPADAESWQEREFRDLCAKYLEAAPPAPVDPEERLALLDRLTRRIGDRLAQSGLAGVPAEDVAMLALLQARSAPRAPTAPQPPSVVKPPDAGASSYSDINKGQEGYIQAVERLAQLPMSERFVMTGDITAGFQSATVSDSPALSSTFGRARLNFVARATPATADGRFSEGYFFVQMVAAGGPFDAGAVGGPRAFSPLNDVATNRSAFNEGLARGNVYLDKAFYQQQARVGQGRLVGRVGVIDFSDFFDTNEFANNEARQFLNGAFVNSLAFKGGVNAPGLMAEYAPGFERDWLRDAVFRAGYGISRTERAFASPLWTLEAELKPRLRGYHGAWRLGGTIGNVAGAGGVRGFYLSADQWTSRHIGVYGRYAVANSGPGSLALGRARESYGGGVQWRLVDREDRVSAWGFGFSQAWGIELENPLSTERALESYYRWQLSNNFSLTPDLQLVLGSGGRPAGGTHMVLGVRMNFGF